MRAACDAQLFLLFQVIIPLTCGVVLLKLLIVFHRDVGHLQIGIILNSPLEIVRFCGFPPEDDLAYLSLLFLQMIQSPRTHQMIGFFYLLVS